MKNLAVAAACIAYGATNLYENTKSAFVINYDDGEQQVKIYTSEVAFNKMISLVPAYLTYRPHVESFSKNLTQREIIVYEDKGVNTVSVMGAALRLPYTADPVVSIPFGMYDLDAQAALYVCKNGVTAVAANDLVTVPALALTASTISALALRRTSPLVNFFTSFMVYQVALPCFSTGRWEAVDQYLLDTISSEEILGGRRYFKAWKRVCGENQMDLFHPSLSSRILRIENHLHLVGVDWNEKQEEEKIRKLAALLKD